MVRRAEGFRKIFTPSFQFLQGIPRAGLDLDGQCLQSSEIIQMVEIRGYSLREMGTERAAGTFGKSFPSHRFQRGSLAAACSNIPQLPTPTLPTYYGNDYARGWVIRKLNHTRRDCVTDGPSVRWTRWSRLWRKIQTSV